MKFEEECLKWLKAWQLYRTEKFKSDGDTLWLSCPKADFIALLRLDKKGYHVVTVFCLSTIKNHYKEACCEHLSGVQK